MSTRRVLRVLTTYSQTNRVIKLSFRILDIIIKYTNSCQISDVGLFELGVLQRE